MTTLRRIDCADALDRAPFFVLGALDAREAAEVRDHLASCSEAHAEFAELGAVVPYLAELAEPVDGGPELRARVMDAIAADVRAQSRDDQAAERLIASFGGSARMPQAGDDTPGPPVPARASSTDDRASDRTAVTPRTANDAAATAPAEAAPDVSAPLTSQRSDATGPAPAGETRPWADEPGFRAAVTAGSPGAAAERSSVSRRFARWAVPAVAALAIAALGAWNVTLQNQVGDATRRAEELRTAAAIVSDPGSRIARLSGSPAAPDAGGFAAFDENGTGVMVITGLPPAPSDRTYQAWFVRGGGSTASAGLVSVERDGMIIVTGLRPGDSVAGMAVTLERAGGVAQSSEQPLVLGTITA